MMLRKFHINVDPNYNNCEINFFYICSIIYMVSLIIWYIIMINIAINVNTNYIYNSIKNVHSCPKMIINSYYYYKMVRINII